MKQEERAFLLEAQAWAKTELGRCTGFWLTNGMDAENGGIYTCLDRQGTLYSTDKSVWMQGRCAWTFSYLCGVYGVRQEWLEAARSCLDFLETHCINHAADGRLYFTVTAEGKPLRQRRYHFSEAFYCMANAEYYGITGESVRLVRARRAYTLIHDLQQNLVKDPAALGPKIDPQTRAGRSLAEPMIFLNCTAIMRRVDLSRTQEYDEYAAACVRDIFDYHFKPELRCTLETVGMDGSFWRDISAGRVVNPGHDIECSWFLMEEANYRHSSAMHQTAESMFRCAIEIGWDKEFDGLLYFYDCLGWPPEAYEHDMKLWWPHNEILIASLMAYRDTGDDYYFRWFEKTLDYCRTHFIDPAYGEWFGYLRRDGRPTEPPCKGSTFKGPFHVPRMLAMVDRMISSMVEEA